MALVLSQQVETKLPIEVDGVTPDRLIDKSCVEIKKLLIQFGNKQIELGEVFKVSGAIGDSETIVFDGILEPVHRIGAGLKSGTIQIDSNAGRHIGSQMSGGEIICKQNVSDFVGCEMTGGTIRVVGNAGDLVGGHYPGSKFGMNRGSILVDGNVGNGLGQAMRRGTIAVGGTAGDLVGWNMLAGTLVVFRECGSHPGAGMKRGTIVLGDGKESQLLPTFSKGGRYRVPVLGMLANWLSQKQFTEASSVSLAMLKNELTEYNGDANEGGRGELFVA